MSEDPTAHPHRASQSEPVVGEIVQPARRSFFTTLMVLVMGLVMVVYLLNPLMGIDLLPDNLPIVGNIDEAAATAILLGCLSYFGIDMPWLRNRKS